MNVGDRIKLNSGARKLPAAQSKFKPGDKCVAKAIVGSLYVRGEVKKKGTLRVPKGWLDHV